MKLGAEIDIPNLIALGVSVYQVGKVSETDKNGILLSEAERSKWFVSVLADSPLVEKLSQIPDADSEDGAWRLAAEHFADFLITGDTQ
jgi:hypothetical protein